MSAHTTTLQEMKAYPCETPGCAFAPSFKVGETNTAGVVIYRYLCNEHFLEMQRQLAKASLPKYCELCGNPGSAFTEIAKFDDPNPGRLYMACQGCVELQEELAAEAFEEEPSMEDEVDTRDLDDSRYEDF